MARTVFANNRNFSHSGSGDKSLCSAPDVCKTPIGNSTPPIPYAIVSQVSDLGGGTSSVKIDGSSTAIANSSHTKCSGDEPGTAKGVASGSTKDKTEFTSYSFDVKAEGKGVVRNMDMTTMNKMNTIGMVLGSMTSPTMIRVEEPEPWDIEYDDVPITIELEIYYHDDIPADWADKCKMWTVNDDGGIYTQEVTLNDTSKVTVQDNCIKVKFEDVLVGEIYACVIDQGQDKSIVVFQQLRVTIDMAVAE